MRPGFNSAVDGFDFSNAADLNPQWLEEWRSVLQLSAPEALNQLRGSFGGALEYYDVPGWMTRVRPSDAAAGAGLVLGAIDSFVWPAATRARNEDLDVYLRQRHLDFWRENGPSLLTWLAVLRKVPEEWLPRALMERRIQRQLQSCGGVGSVEVRIDLHLPVPGGGKWLRGQSVGQLRIIRAKVAAEGFCPIVVFTDRGMEVLLAIECDPELRCYDPARPGTDRVIDRAALQGVFCIRYSPRKPPLSVWQRAAGSIGLKGATRDLTRAWRIGAWRRRLRRASL